VDGTIIRVSSYCCSIVFAGQAQTGVYVGVFQRQREQQQQQQQQQQLSDSYSSSGSRAD